MKKRFFKHPGLLMAIATVAVAVGFSSCKKEPTTPPTQPSLEVRYNAEVAPNGKELDQVAKSGGSSTISIEATRSWTVSIPAGDTWLTADTKSGSANKGKPTSVKLTAAANDGAARTSTVTISLTEGGVSQTVIFRQNGTVPAGDITISQIRAMYTGTDVTITDDKTLIATVISDANTTTGGNSTSKNNMVLQDAEAGIAIRLAAAPTGTYNVGDVVSIKVKDLTISAYNFMVQMNNVPETAITKTGTTNTIEAKSITPAELLTGDYESMYVAVSGVQFVSDHVGKKVNDPVLAVVGTAKHSVSTLETQDSKNITVFVSAYAAFYSTFTLPEGSGVMKGIAGVSKDQDNQPEIQIQPRTAADYDGLTEARFAETPRFGVSSQAVSVPAAGGEVTVDVTGNVEWAATVKDGGDNLVSVPAPTGTGAGTITLDFKANTDTANDKVVTITVTTTAEVETKSFDVVFTQAAALPAGEKVAVFDIPNMGITSGTDWNTQTVNGITIAAAGGGNTNTPKFYSTGTPALRTYLNNTLTFTGGEIIKIEFTNGSRSDGIVASPAGLSGTTWTGSATTVIFTTGPATTEVPNPQHHFTSITVTYK